MQTRIINFSSWAKESAEQIADAADHYDEAKSRPSYSSIHKPWEHAHRTTNHVNEQKGDKGKSVEQTVKHEKLHSSPEKQL